MAVELGADGAVGAVGAVIGVVAVVGFGSVGVNGEGPPEAETVGEVVFVCPPDPEMAIDTAGDGSAGARLDDSRAPPGAGDPVDPIELPAGSVPISASGGVVTGDPVSSLAPFVLPSVPPSVPSTRTADSLAGVDSPAPAGTAGTGERRAAPVSSTWAFTMAAAELAASTPTIDNAVTAPVFT